MGNESLESGSPKNQVSGSGFRSAVMTKTYRHFPLLTEHPIIPFPCYHALYFPLTVSIQNDIEGYARFDQR